VGCSLTLLLTRLLQALHGVISLQDTAADRSSPPLAASHGPAASSPSRSAPSLPCPPLPLRPEARRSRRPPHPRTRTDPRITHERYRTLAYLPRGCSLSCSICRRQSATPTARRSPLAAATALLGHILLGRAHLPFFDVELALEIRVLACVRGRRDGRAPCHQTRVISSAIARVMPLTLNPKL